MWILLILVATLGQNVPQFGTRYAQFNMPMLHPLRVVLLLRMLKCAVHVVAQQCRRPIILSLMQVLFVIAGECLSAFEREHYHPNNIMPERPLCAVFAVNQTSENSEKDIFQDVFKTTGMLAHGVRCLQRVSNDSVSVLPLARTIITTSKRNVRLHDISPMAVANCLLHLN